jgi:hypothetical protein
MLEKGDYDENDGPLSRFRVAAFFVQLAASTANLYPRAYPNVLTISGLIAGHSNPNCQPIIAGCDAVGLVCTASTFGNR